MDETSIGTEVLNAKPLRYPNWDASREGNNRITSTPPAQMLRYV